MTDKSVCNIDRLNKNRPMGATTTSYASGTIKNEKINSKTGMGMNYKDKKMRYLMPAGNKKGYGGGGSMTAMKTTKKKNNKAMKKGGSAPGMMNDKA